MARAKLPLNGIGLEIVRGLSDPDPQARARAARKHNRMLAEYPGVAAAIRRAAVTPAGMIVDDRGRLVLDAADNASKNRAATTIGKVTLNSLTEASHFIQQVHDSMTVDRKPTETLLVLSHGKPIRAASVPGVWRKTSSPSARIDALLRSGSVHEGTVEVIKHVGSFAAELAIADARTSTLFKTVMSTRNRNLQQNNWHVADQNPDPNYVLAELKTDDYEPISMVQRNWLAAKMVEDSVTLGDSAGSDASLQSELYHRRVELITSTWFAVDATTAELVSPSSTIGQDPVMLGHDEAQYIEGLITEGIKNDGSAEIYPAISQFILTQSFTP